jgi:predicted CoA-binding protein
MTPSDPIGDLLARTRSIAVIGWSPEPARPSHYVTAYLVQVGFEVARVNPNARHLGTYAKLADVPGPVDLVVVFRRPEEAPAHVQEAIAAGARAVWLQEGVTTPDGGEAARRAGLGYVEDRCVMVEHERRH